MKIIAVPNDTRTGFRIPSEYSKALFLEWLKTHNAFEITPVVEDSKEGRGYLFGAVVPSYCHWQYGIDPREPGRSDQRKFLFMRDFNNEIVENRDGDPERIPLSSKGKVRQLNETYRFYADQNGAPMPNPELYKKWKAEWSMDPRFPTFHDWLAFLGIEEDAMPSAETLAPLQDDAAPKMPEYPDNYEKPAF
ncbi:hypothetical protein [Amorphus orientalis]|uniref:Uncharacterized protein n=1 Tax=Amorphus orientalis TaxID=649198 RepID=A0AAE3VPE7_9HYPH|nr:hypothetical protein [Amorphus orientalis]MDQ0316389.1 hypothetical protein [Amorphus orientalis]